MTALAIDHDMHRASIAPLKPFFSHAGITRVESRVDACVLKLGQKLEELASVNTEPKSPVIVNLTHAFNSYTNGKGYHLEKPLFTHHGLCLMRFFV
jgi:hypothetical protein